MANPFGNFDAGGGSEGPWISWSARGSLDGVIPPRSFVIRDENGKSPFDMTQGVVLDLETAKTGWCFSTGMAGQAPQWKWNDSIARFAPNPGDGWKRGFQIRIAIGGGQSATWEDSGAGAWNAFAELGKLFGSGPDNQLPMVRMIGVREERYAAGSTTIAVFDVVKWVDRPDCLKGSVQGFDTGAQTSVQPAQQPVTGPSPHAAQQPAPQYQPPQSVPVAPSVSAPGDFSVIDDKEF